MDAPRLATTSRDRERSARTSAAGGAHAIAARKSVLLAVCVAAIPFALLVARFDFVCDDAYIAFRYARHLAEGRGLLFNVGEEPRVEGYSNLLWVLWLAPFERWGIDVPTIARATSIACGAVLLACTTRLAQSRFELGRASTVCCALFLATLPPIAMWSTGGLETMPFALCTFLVFERLCGDPDRPRGVHAGVLAAVAALVRADGALWIGLVLACAGVGIWVRRDKRLAIAAMITLAFLVVAVASQVAWRVAYYGELVPNTARVKAGMSAMRLERGLKYLASFLLACPVCAFVPLAAAWMRRDRRDVCTLQAIVFLVGAAMYALYVGGDFMAMGRFIVPAMPFVAVLLAACLASLERTRGAAIASTFGGLAIGAAALACADWNIAPDALRQLLHFRWNDTRARGEIEIWRGMRDRAAQWAIIGRGLALHARPNDSITLKAIGAIGYYSDVTIYDEFGLVDVDVAKREAPLVRASPGHDKVVGPEFYFDRKPTYLDAYLARQGAPPSEGLPPDWSANPLSRMVDVVTYPLRVEDGFPPGIELRLLRFRWTS
jgi:arabinofuranosyltransferase